ncbi:MAG: helix-turn-helix domain-containing protein [Longimicrobiales bacterium]
MPRSKPTTDAVGILERLTAADAGMRALVEEERTHALVARQIHHLRTRRGLTQKELAERVGTTQSVIARIEDADYQGHSLRMLRRVAEALDAEVSVRLVPAGSAGGR